MDKEYFLSKLDDAQNMLTYYCITNFLAGRIYEVPRPVNMPLIGGRSLNIFILA